MFPSVDVNIDFLVRNDTSLYIILTAKQVQSANVEYIISQLVLVFFNVLKIAEENGVKLEPISPIPSLSEQKENMLLALFKFSSSEHIKQFFISLKNYEGSL